MCSRSKIFALAIMFVVSGCANAFRDFGDKSSDEYLIAQARNQLDALDFDAAIASITPVLASQPDNEDVVYLAAAAYAGRGGLRVLDLFVTIGEDIDTKTILQIFAEHFEGATDDSVADIEKAIDIIEDFGPRAVDRSGDLNFFAMFVYYSRIGVILNRYGYDSTNTLRTNFTACHKVEDLAGAKTGLPDEMVDRIMTAVPRILDSITGVAGEGGALDVLTDTAGLPSGLSFDPIPCSANSLEPTCVAARVLVNEGSASGGIGLGVTSDPDCTSGGITP